MPKRDPADAEHDDESSSKTGFIVKGVLIGVGAIFALSIAMSLFKLALIAAVIGGIGYGGYRLLGGGKELPDGDAGQPKKLGAAGSSDALARRMKELDALDKKLDEQLKRLENDGKKS